jgi:hypothetical protein
LLQLDADTAANDFSAKPIALAVDAGEEEKSAVVMTEAAKTIELSSADDQGRGDRSDDVGGGGDDDGVLETPARGSGRRTSRAWRATRR